MVKSVIRLLVIMLLIVLLVLNPIPFVSFEDIINNQSIQQTLKIRGGFDPLQRKAKNTLGLPNQNKPNKSAVAKPKPKHGSSSNSSQKKITYKPLPGSSPRGSGNYDYDENLSENVDPDKTISDPEFWNSIETLGESDAEDESAPIQAPKNSPPTKKLTKEAIKDKKNNALTKIIHPTAFTDWEGENKVIKSKEIKKTVYAHGYEAGVVPAEDLIPCPVQEDKFKFQRENCALITDESVDRMTNKIIDLATSTKPNRVKIELPTMPYDDREKAIGYMDTKTGDCAFFHEDGKYWTYKKYEKDEISSTLAKSDSIKYAKDYNTEL